jgi:hypothetical protein
MLSGVGGTEGTAVIDVDHGFSIDGKKEHLR